MVSSEKVLGAIFGTKFQFRNKNGRVSEEKLGVSELFCGLREKITASEKLVPGACCHENQSVRAELLALPCRFAPTASSAPSSHGSSVQKLEDCLRAQGRPPKKGGEACRQACRNAGSDRQSHWPQGGAATYRRHAQEGQGYEGTQAVIALEDDLEDAVEDAQRWQGRSDPRRRSSSHLEDRPDRFGQEEDARR